MLKILLGNLSNHYSACGKKLVLSSIFKRNFLSSAYELESEFNARLNNNILKQVNPSSMYLELDQQYNRHKKLHAIDVDLYVNSILSDVHTEELEDVLYKFRLTPTTIDMMDSTSHAFIRLYLKLNKIEELLTILDDRLNYGIFPDEYCNNLLMNYFIKSQNYRDAAKVAAIQMLQEDFSNEITKQLALYSCLKYLQEPTTWQTAAAEAEEEAADEGSDDEEEDVRVRVKFLRNPYFDGHFDLRTPNELIGKTLTTIGRLASDSVSQSYYLVGLGLGKHVNEARQFLEGVGKGEKNVSKEAVEMFKKYVVAGELGTEAENADISEDVQSVLRLADQIVSSGSSENLLQVTEEKLKEVVKQFEAQEIEAQKKKYITWDSERKRILQAHVEKLKEEETFKDIEQMKAQLAAEEEKIFFFDNETQIELQLEQKYPPKEEIVVKKRNEFDGMRNLGRTHINKTKKKLLDEHYVPPDMHKPYKQ